MKSRPNYDWLKEEPPAVGGASSPASKQQVMPPLASPLNEQVVAQKSPRLSAPSSLISKTGKFAAMAAALLAGGGTIHQVAQGTRKADFPVSSRDPHQLTPMEAYLQQKAREEDRPDRSNKQWRVELELGRYACDGKMDIGFISTENRGRQSDRFAYFILWEIDGPTATASVRKLDFTVAELRGVPAVHFFIVCAPDGSVKISSAQGVYGSSEGQLHFVQPDNDLSEKNEASPDALAPVLENLREQLAQRPVRTGSPHTWLPATETTKEDAAQDFLRLIVREYNTRTAKDTNVVSSQ